jgi:hypothetical protein
MSGRLTAVGTHRRAGSVVSGKGGGGWRCGRRTCVCMKWCKGEREKEGEVDKWVAPVLNYFKSSNFIQTWFDRKGTFPRSKKLK